MHINENLKGSLQPYLPNLIPLPMGNQHWLSGADPSRIYFWHMAGGGDGVWGKREERWKGKRAGRVGFLQSFEKALSITLN